MEQLEKIKYVHAHICLEVNMNNKREASVDDKKKLVAKIFNALGHPARIVVLEKLKEEESPVDIAGDLRMTRGALQAHLDKLMDADLIWQDPEDPSDRYLLQPLGEKALRLVDKIPNELRFEQVVPAFKNIESKRPTIKNDKNVRIDVEAGFAFSVSKRFYDRAIRRQLQKEKNEELKRIFRK